MHPSIQAEKKKNTPSSPDITQAFEVAIQDLQTQIGRENVVVNNAEHLEDGWYIKHPNTHDTFHIVEHDELVASALVYPGFTSEMQTVVRWANKHSIPIYPIANGRNLGYGGVAPRVPGGVVVDLGKRMHQILNIDAENGSCLVGPGVTSFKLYEEIEKRGLPLWIDTPDLGGGSVLGNAIDLGVGYTPYGGTCTAERRVVANRHVRIVDECSPSHREPISYMLTKTHRGAMPGPDGKDNPFWQSFQYAYGPSVDGIFSQ